MSGSPLPTNHSSQCHYKDYVFLGFQKTQYKNTQPKFKCRVYCSKWLRNKVVGIRPFQILLLISGANSSILSSDVL